MRSHAPSPTQQNMPPQAGVRFVYFSSRNMRRSKPVAEKIGLQFDWNCAISLRALDGANCLDPHRYISQYADWDVHARMPHGIKAIEHHLKEVRDGPLSPLVLILSNYLSPGSYRALPVSFYPGSYRAASTCLLFPHAGG